MPVIIAILYLSKVITVNEADKLQKELRVMSIPQDWAGVVLQFEKIIGRPLSYHNFKK